MLLTEKKKPNVKFKSPLQCIIADIYSEKVKLYFEELLGFISLILLRNRRYSKRREV